jgi:hypothetical protein
LVIDRKDVVVPPCPVSISAGDTVFVRYGMWFLTEPSGERALVFDNRDPEKDEKSQNATKIVVGSGTVVRGIELGIAGMCPGESVDLTIPPALGFGRTAVGEVPANSKLAVSLRVISMLEPELSEAEWTLRLRRDHQKRQAAQLSEIRATGKLNIGASSALYVGLPEPNALKANVTTRVLFRGNVSPSDGLVAFVRRNETCADQWSRESFDREAGHPVAMEPFSFEARRSNVRLPRGIFKTCYSSTNDMRYVSWVEYTHTLLKVF